MSRWVGELERVDEPKEPATRRLEAYLPLVLLVFAMACGGAAPSPAPTTRRATGDSGAVVVREDTPRETDAAPVDTRTERDPARVVESREGRASYYSDRLAGRSTASGEPYDPRALTAASRDLPFGTRVRVHRVDAEGRSIASVVVRVNDRGPFRDHSRILDLSRAAAERLDMIRAGVVSIRAEILGD